MSAEFYGQQQGPKVELLEILCSDFVVCVTSSWNLPQARVGCLSQAPLEPEPCAFAAALHHIIFSLIQGKIFFSRVCLDLGSAVSG